VPKQTRQVPDLRSQLRGQRRNFTGLPSHRLSYKTVLGFWSLVFAKTESPKPKTNLQ
jgi:hypothetical protein